MWILTGLAALRAFFASAAREATIVGSAAPSLSTIILLIVFGVGGYSGFKIGGWWTEASVRRDVNAEWRSKIATANPAVKAIVAAGNDEGEAIDASVIKEIGDTYAKFKTASSLLATSRKAPAVSRCSVPADCLH